MENDHGDLGRTLKTFETEKVGIRLSVIVIPRTKTILCPTSGGRGVVGQRIRQNRISEPPDALLGYSLTGRCIY